MEKLDPARSIIELCGGALRIAEWLGLDASGVHRWSYPKTRKGYGGMIPAHHQEPLLKAAQSAGVDLRPEHFMRSFWETKRVVAVPTIVPTAGPADGEGEAAA